MTINESQSREEGLKIGDIENFRNRVYHLKKKVCKQKVRLVWHMKLCANTHTQIVASVT